MTERKKKTMRPLLLIAALALVVGCVQILPIHGESDIYDAVLRLHVIANSDTEEDQALKLQVRDAVLGVTTSVLADCDTREQAIATLEQHMDELQQAAEQVIAAQGYAYEVTLLLGEEQYPTRSYESFCFPAGEYVSLRVMIGAAQGQNFWCVLFPPLCMSAASARKTQAEEELIAVGLSRDQYAIITETQQTKYRLRFKILEVVEQLCDWFR